MRIFEYWDNKGLQSLEEIKKDVYVLTQRSIIGDIITLLAPERNKAFNKREMAAYIQKHKIDFFRIGKSASEMIDCFIEKYEKAVS